MMSRHLVVTKVEILGRRWFQRTYGNTYNTAAIYVNDVLIHKTPKQYGYGQHYEDLALDWLDKNGYMPGREHHPNGGAEPGWRYFRDRRKVEYLAHAVDVKRERDL